MKPKLTKQSARFRSDVTSELWRGLDEVRLRFSSFGEISMKLEERSRTLAKLDSKSEVGNISLLAEFTPTPIMD